MRTTIYLSSEQIKEIEVIKAYFEKTEGYQISTSSLFKRLVKEKYNEVVGK